MQSILLIISSPSKCRSKAPSSQAARWPHATVSQGPAGSPGTPIWDRGALSGGWGLLEPLWLVAGVPELAPQGEGVQDSVGWLPPPLGKASLFHTASIPEVGFLAGEGGGCDTLPELCPRPRAWQPPIPKFSSCCCRCKTPSQRNGDSTSMGKIWETTCIAAT